MFVVVGTGRSGTTWMTEALNACGLKVGHEAVFTPYSVPGFVPLDWGDYDGDCSWMAVPVLHRVPDATVIHVVRDPLLVVQSWVDLGLFDQPTPCNPYMGIIADYTPAVFAEAQPIDRVLAHWIGWNNAAEAQADVTVRIEDMPIALENLPLGLDLTLLPDLPDDVNAKTDLKDPRDRVRWSDFRHGLITQAQALASHYGYSYGRRA